MIRVNRYAAIACAVIVSAGVSRAENHPGSFGQYSTAVAESRLFVGDNDVTALRCDLFFTAAGSDQVIVAPKGSIVTQTVPDFVWRFSGVLPVTDYLKTVAIHSVSSANQKNSWQNVQLALYSGLRVEGASESGAKIAYAGAYAFAPRWPLVELLDIPDPRQIPNSKLYKVKYTTAGNKGVTVSEFQALARDILSQPQAISLEDIRDVVDASDAAKVVKAQRVAGSSIGNLFDSNRDVKGADESSQSGAEKPKEATIGTLVEDLFRNNENNVPAEPQIKELPELPVKEVLPGVAKLPPQSSLAILPPYLDEQPQTQTQQSPQPAIEVVEDTGKTVLIPEDVNEVIIDADPAVENQTPTIKVDTSLGAQPNVWEVMPNGTAVLLQIEG